MVKKVQNLNCGIFKFSIAHNIVFPTYRLLIKLKNREKQVNGRGTKIVIGGTKRYD